MRRSVTVLISLALIVIVSMQSAPVNAASVSAADLVGEWTAKLEINNLEIIGTPDISKDDINKLADKTQKLVFTQSGGALYLDLPLPPVSQVKLTLNGDQLDGTYRKKTDEGTYDMYVNGKATKKGSDASFSLNVGGSIVSDNQKDIIVFFYIYTSKDKAAAAPPSTTMEEPIDFGTGQEKGRITFIQGRAYIHRMGRIIPATVSESLMAGDLIVMDEGEVTIEGNEGGSLKFVGRTRFALPEEKAVKKTSSSALSEMLGDIWTKTKEFLRGESFEVKTPTGTCGVRG